MNRFHAFNIRAKIVARPTPPIAAGLARSFSTLSAHKLGHDPRRHRRNRRPGWARHIGNLFQPDERETNGVVYVADSGNSKIRKPAPTP
ncbi:hypothetical protein [Cupriavidus basilensis]|uniref:hypothetical protein n=1 Tax=Cupriavidus basilensis TaxID=68895 RepID=UPI0020A67A85|nr:hypothetical protein [Cupriavidus basilensis]MCP3017576.1 hypothetical protein [Cupriavidus basilensis]